MLIKSSLKEIEVLVRDLKNKDVNDQLASYDAILALLERIEESIDVQKYPNYPVYKSDLLEMCKVVCGLAKSNSIDEGQYIGRAILTLRKMESYTCFNVNGHYI